MVCATKLLVTILAALPVCLPVARAQDYPDKPLRMPELKKWGAVVKLADIRGE